MPPTALPDWARWRAPADPMWSVRISEDAMIVEPGRRVLAALDAGELRGLSPLLAAHASSEAGLGVVTLTTTPHVTVAACAAELALLREELTATVAQRFGFATGAAGLHPWSECALPSTLGPLRPRPPTQLAGILGRLDPTCSLRVEVGVADPEAAVRAFDGLRAQLPLLLALSANSPLWRGRYTGLASSRTALRASLGEPGLPRHFASYGEYVETVDALMRGGATDHPGTIGWDLRLQPGRGAVEITVMDAQTRIGDVIGLAALVQCLVRLSVDQGSGVAELIPELVLANRAAAARAGMRATMLDRSGRGGRAMEQLWTVMESCTSVACELDCGRELAHAARTAADAGHLRQRR